jgi:hypothetical protein
MATAQEYSLQEHGANIDALSFFHEYPNPITDVENASEAGKGKVIPGHLNIKDSLNTLDFLSKTSENHKEADLTSDSKRPDQNDNQPRKWSYKLGWNKSITIFPVTDLYPSYIADPRFPRFSITMMHMTSRSIEQTSERRIGTSMGASFGLFRIHSDDRPEGGFQLQIGAGIFAQWDAKMAQDGIGLDGVYHVLGTWTMGHSLAFRLGLNHMSSHISDEYIENTGQERIGYTREEIAGGVSYILAKHWRTYADVGYFYPENITPPRERWRLQGGLEYESDLIFFDGFAGWFAALDAKSYEEDDWDISTNLQVGIFMPQRYLSRVHRVALEFYHGRSPMGEFFQNEESHIALGWWLEF